jgi:hypothetical protein
VRCENRPHCGAKPTALRREIDHTAQGIDRTAVRAALLAVAKARPVSRKASAERVHASDWLKEDAH